MNLDKQLEELKKLNLDPATEARLREDLRRRSMWNQGKLVANGWTKKLIKTLLGEPHEILSGQVDAFFVVGQFKNQGLISQYRFAASLSTTSQ